MRWAGQVCALIVLMNAPAAAAEPEGSPLFPFVAPWNDASPGAPNVSDWLDRPAGKHGPIVVKDGHLFAGKERIRLFGVNLCFGANFPKHEDAEQIAARMAKFGINCVRFHHMDMLAAPGGILAADRKTLEPGQLDRLDYLVAELKKNGIYADLNLHVSRTYPDLPTWSGMPSYFKGVDNFEPRMIESQRQYARDLLTHRNAYTRNRYVDEPAIALIEINNENALMQDWWGGRLDEMPSAYTDVLAKAWNAWLGKQYRGFAELKRGWGASDQPLGKEMLTNGRFDHGLDGWALEQHEGARANAKPELEERGTGKALHIKVETKAKAGWHVQLAHSRLAFRKDQPYTLHFRARADATRQLTVNAMQAHDPWRSFWSTTLPLSEDWQSFSLTFPAGEGDSNARITFSNFGSQTGSVWLADVSLKPGGRLGLREEETWGKLPIFRKRDFSSRTPEAQRDWIRFLLATEDNYWTGMYRFIKNDLGAKALVIGTQMGWSPAPVQAKLDVIDSHAYWQHPHFPGKSWDMNNWTVQNIPMAGAPDGGTLPRLALARVAGKPFVCTEYNHPAPNTYSSEAFLLLSAFAAMQDWDGVFAFAYSHRGDDWNTRRIPSFFDIDQHPTKMVTLPAAVAMFVRGDVPAAPRRSVATADMPAMIDRLRVAGPYLGADAFGIDRAAALKGRVALGLDNSPASTATGDGNTEWSWAPGGKKVVVVNAPRSRAVIGAMPEGDRFALGDVQIQAGATRQKWAAITLTLLEGSSFASPCRALITATGDVQNTDMGWKNPAHDTVGRDWGKAPSLVEGIAARITLPARGANVRAWALDERGSRKTPVAIESSGEHAVLPIASKYRTLWYELEVLPGL